MSLLSLGLSKELYGLHLKMSRLGISFMFLTYMLPLVLICIFLIKFFHIVVSPCFSSFSSIFTNNTVVLTDNTLIFISDACLPVHYSIV